MYTFVMLDGKEGDNVQDVDIDYCKILKIGDLDANVRQIWRVDRNLSWRVLFLLIC